MCLLLEHSLGIVAKSEQKSILDSDRLVVVVEKGSLEIDILLALATSIAISMTVTSDIKPKCQFISISTQSKGFFFFYNATLQPKTIFCMSR